LQPVGGLGQPALIAPKVMLMLTSVIMVIILVMMMKGVVEGRNCIAKSLLSSCASAQ